MKASVLSEIFFLTCKNRVLVLPLVGSIGDETLKKPEVRWMTRPYKPDHASNPKKKVLTPGFIFSFHSMPARRNFGPLPFYLSADSL